MSVILSQPLYAWEILVLLVHCPQHLSSKEECPTLGTLSMISLFLIFIIHLLSKYRGSFFLPGFICRPCEIINLKISQLYRFSELQVQRTVVIAGPDQIIFVGLWWSAGHIFSISNLFETKGRQERERQKQEEKETVERDRGPPICWFTPQQP